MNRTFGLTGLPYGASVARGAEDAVEVELAVAVVAVVDGTMVVGAVVRLCSTPDECGIRL